MTGYFGNDLPVITQGIISKVFPDKLGIFLTTTDINSGNSGGPIFNLDGNLVGISVATLDKKIMEETGNIPTSMGIGIKSNMLKEVFKYKKTIPARNVKYNKSKLYEQMLPMVVFIAVEADPKIKAKKLMRVLAIFFILFYKSHLYGEIVTAEGIFKHIGDISQNKACQLAREKSKR